MHAVVQQQRTVPTVHDAHIEIARATLRCLIQVNPSRCT